MDKRKIRFRVSRDLLSNLDRETIDTLRKMTLRYWSMMRETLDEETELHSSIEIAVARNKDSVPLGWALRRPWRGKELVMVFVKPRVRRQGVGTALVKRLKNKKTVYRSWNKPSELFFQKMEGKVAIGSHASLEN